MRPQLVVVALACAALSSGGGCAPATILSARTIKDDPPAVYPQLVAALASEYQCKDGSDDVAFAAHCKSERGGISVELKKKTDRPVLSLHFWLANPRCGTAELAIRLEQFVLRDASGGTRAYCQDGKLVLAFDSYLPARGVEAAELASFVVLWEKSALQAAERGGLLDGQGPS
jgi:hypothetical protein